MLLTDDPTGDQAANLALEEALVRAGLARPLLRIWRNDRCVVIGRAQRVAREVNLTACAAGGVPVLRRSSGGGAVYQDLGNLNITLAAPGRVFGLAADLADLVTGVIAGFGLPARAADRGVFVATAKVSGLAGQVTRDGSLAHATLLVTTPAERVGAFLAPAPADSHPADSRRSPVAALRDLRCEVSVAAVRYAVLAEAARRFGRLRRRPLTDPERHCQQRLLTERYSIASWHRTGQMKET